MAENRVQTCPACRGAGVTEHVQHTVEPGPDGEPRHVERRTTQSCGRCNGRGTVG